MTEPELIDAIRELRRRNVTIRDIARQLDLNVHTAERLVYRHRIPRGEPGQRQHRVDTIRAMRAERATVRHIAAVLGISSDAVTHYITWEAIPLGSAADQAAEQQLVDTVRAMRAERATIATIAATTGRSKRVIDRVIAHHHIPLPGRTSHTDDVAELADLVRVGLEQAAATLGHRPSVPEYNTWRRQHRPELPASDLISRRFGGPRRSWLHAMRTLGITATPTRDRYRLD